MLPVCKGARPPRAHLEAQAGPDHPRLGLCPPESLSSPAQPTPAKCAGSTCLGAVGRAQIPECPNPGSVWGEGCSVRLQDGFHPGGLRRGTSGPGGRGPMSALEAPPPPGRMGCCCGYLHGACVGKGGAGAGLGEAAPSLHVGPRRHHYQAVLETRHHPMLPSKMATAAPNWVWGPPSWGLCGGDQQPGREPCPLRARGGEGSARGRASALGAQPGEGWTAAPGCPPKARTTRRPPDQPALAGSVGPSARGLGWTPKEGQDALPTGGKDRVGSSLWVVPGRGPGHVALPPRGQAACACECAQDQKGCPGRTMSLCLPDAAPVALSSPAPSCPCQGRGRVSGQGWSGMWLSRQDRTGRPPQPSPQPSHPPSPGPLPRPPARSQIGLSARPLAPWPLGAGRCWP